MVASYPKLSVPAAQPHELIDKRMLGMALLYFISLYLQIQRRYVPGNYTAGLQIAQGFQKCHYRSAKSIFNIIYGLPLNINIAVMLALETNFFSRKSLNQCLVFSPVEGRRMTLESLAKQLATSINWSHAFPGLFRQSCFILIPIALALYLDYTKTALQKYQFSSAAKTRRNHTMVASYPKLSVLAAQPHDTDLR